MNIYEVVHEYQAAGEYFLRIGSSDEAEWALATGRQAAAEASHQCVCVPCLSYTLIHLIQLALIGVLGTSSFMSRQILSHGSKNGKD
jgi:hypothetical protein